jgi:hypothetical protein
MELCIFLVRSFGFENVPVVLKAQGSRLKHLNRTPSDEAWTSHFVTEEIMQVNHY